MTAWRASLARRVIASQPRQVGLVGGQAEVLAEDEVVDALGAEHERHLVDVGDVVGRDDRLDRQAREQRDLAADVGGEHRLRAAHDHVRARYRCGAAR